MNIREKVAPALQLKFLSLLLAVLLWLFVLVELSDETDIPLEVTYINIPAGLKLKESEARQIYVHAVGPRILLLRQRLKGVSAKLDLSTVTEGKNTLAGFESSLLTVRGVKFTRVSPVTIEVYPDPVAGAGASHTK
jgi:hypothetical protein